MSDVVTLAASSLDELRRRGLSVPTYDRTELVPRIVHIGVGGFHRSHLAAYCHDLANLGSDWGICGVGLLDSDRLMADVLASQDHLFTLTTRQRHTVHTEIVGSIIDFILAADDTTAAIDRIGRASTSIVSMTITEAGYDISERNLRTFDVIAAGLARRRDNGVGGVTIMSCDNMTGNGDAAKRSVIHAADRRDDTLAGWVLARCTFPNSMVDRITPATSDADRRHLVDTYGLVDRWPVVAETYRKWIITDDFAAGRPDIETVGAALTDNVRSWELYKLRLLNAGHSAIAYLAALGGLEYVDEAIAVPELHGFLRAFLLDESAPNLSPIPGHPPAEYVDDVIGRFANSGIRDQISRICVDGRAKATTFIMPILSDQLDAGRGIQHSCHALAAWARYLAVVPPAEQAPDPTADLIRPLANAALEDPTAFIHEDAGFPDRLVRDTKFADAFTRAYEAITRHGPLGALRALQSDGT